MSGYPVRWHRGFRVLSVATGLMAVSAVAASNDFEVQASNVTALKAGTTFEKGARIVVPAGGSITLIDRTGGTAKTLECAGRYEGPVERCTAPTASRASPTVPGGNRGVAD